jgi:hypothetical protein
LKLEIETCFYAWIRVEDVFLSTDLPVETIPATSL